MSQGNERAARVQIVSLTLLVCLVPFAIYYLVYYRATRTYLLDRNQRVVAAIAQGGEDRLASLHHVMQNAASLDAAYLDARRLRTIGADATCEAIEAPLRDSAKTAFANVPGLTFVDATATATNGTPPSPATSVSSSAGDNGRLLQLSYDGPVSYPAERVLSTRLKGPKASAALPECAVHLQANVSLSAFVGDLDRHDLFDEVAVVDDQGRVLMQTTGHGTRLAQFVRDAKPNGPEATAEGKGLPDSDEALRSIDLGGEGYRVFEQPMQLSLTASDATAGNDGQPKASAAPDWRIYGIVRDSRLRDQTLSLPTLPMLVLLFSLLLSILAWPFLKVALLGRQDRLRALDMHLLKASVAVGVGVLTIFLLGGVEHHRMMLATDGALDTLSSKIARTLRDELRSAVAQLVEYRDRFPGQQKSFANVRTDLIAKEPLRYSALQMLISIDPRGVQTRKWTVSQRATRFISVSDRNYVDDIQHDRYLVRCTQSSDWCFDTPYTVHALWSRNVGSKLALVAIPDVPEQASKPDSIKDRGLVALTSELRSLWHTAMPLGFSFAVIASDGQVLFHSDTRRSLEENLYQETDEDRDLRAAVDIGKDRRLTLSYLGKKHRAHISPLGATPWSLVVFSDTGYIEAVLLETIVTTLALLLALALCVAIVRVLYMLRLGTARSQWAWPSREERKVSAYWLAALLCLSVLVVQASAALIAGRARPLLAALGIVIAFFVVRYLLGAGRLIGSQWLFARWPSESMRARLRSPLAAEHSYLLAVLGVLGLLIVAPTVTAFYVVYEDYRAALLLMSHAELGKQIEARERAIYENHLKIEMGSPRALRMAVALSQGASAGDGSERPDLPWGVYSAAPFVRDVARTAGVRSAPPPSSGHGIAASFRRDLPSFNDLARRLREVAIRAPARDDDDSVQPTDRQRDVVTEFPPSQAASFAELGGLQLRSSLDDFPAAFDGRTTVFAAAACGVLVFLIYLAMRFIARYVFGLGFERVLPLTPKTLAPAEGHVLHLGMPDSGLAVLKRKLRAFKVGEHSAVPCFVDCRVVELSQALPEGCTHIVLHHFESCLVTPQRTQRALGALEAWVFGSRCSIVVVSEIDPVYYLNERRQDTKRRDSIPVAAADGKAAAPSVREDLPDVIRWAEVFSHFDRAHHRVLDIAPSELHMDHAEWQKSRQARFESQTDRQAVPPEPVRSTIELPKLLIRECAWDEQLHPIARAIHGVAEAAEPRAGRRRQAEELVQQVGNRAAPRHRFVWSMCTNTEKLLLVHMAQEGTINPRNWDVAHLLVTRGLLHWHGGMFMFASQSFERFVAQAMRPEDILALQRHAPSTWSRVSAPLLSLLVLVFGFFFWSQPGLTEVLLAVLSAGTAAIAASLRFVGIAGGGQQRGREINA